MQSFESLLTGWTIRLDGDANFDLLFNQTKHEIDEVLRCHNVDFDIGLILPPSTDDVTVSMWLEIINI